MKAWSQARRSAIYMWHEEVLTTLHMTDDPAPGMQVQEIHTTLHKHLAKEEEQLLPLLLQHFTHAEQVGRSDSCVLGCLAGGGTLMARPLHSWPW